MLPKLSPDKAVGLKRCERRGCGAYCEAYYYNCPRCGGAFPSENFCGRILNKPPLKDNRPDDPGVCGNPIAEDETICESCAYIQSLAPSIVSDPDEAAARIKAVGET